MPNNIKISDLDLASQLNEADLLLLSQQESESESEEFDSKKTTVGNLAEKVATGVQFSGLQTDSKTITGAINEAAAVGKISESYHKETLTPNSYKEWEDSETKVDGHTVYQSHYETYEKTSGDSLATWTVEGLNDVTFYIKQDGASASDTNKAYTVLGKANTPIDLEDETSFAESYKGEVLSDYTSYKFENLNGATKTFQILYHTDPLEPSGTATVNLNSGQFVDTGTTIDGHTVYMSDAGSYQVPYGESKCRINLEGVGSFKIYYKVNTDRYNYIYIGELDTPLYSDYDTRTWGNEDYNYTHFTCSKNESHFVEIAYYKRNSLDSKDDRIYFYIVLEGDPHTTRGYIYAEPGQIIETSHGEIFNDYEHNFAVGINSHAEGENTLASGQDSHAEGYGTTASYFYAHAEGYQTTASNSAAHAEGYQTTASYSYAHAEGIATTASGHASHAEGQNTIASGSECHAEGEYTVASYEQAHAEGYHTTASGRTSHAEGYYTIASGNYSHAEGYGNDSYHILASGDGSHAEGFATQATATGAHAEGYRTTASREGSHAEGEYTTASGFCSHVEGYENTASEQGAHAEGSRNVASKLDSHAEGESTKATGVGAHSEGGFTTASGKYSHAEGSNFSYGTEGPKASGIAAHAEGILTKAEGMGSHAEGMPAIKYPEYDSTETYNTDDIIYYFVSQDNTDTILYFAKAKVDNIQGISPEDEGAWHYWDTFSPSDLSSYFYSANGNYGSTAIGMGAHAEGIVTLAASNGSHAEGTFYVEGNSPVIAYAPGTHAEGQGSQAHSPGAHAEGTGTHAYAPSTHAEGINTQASGDGSHAEGIGTLAVGSYQHVQGRYNTTDGYQAFIIGNGSETEGTITRSNALTVDWNGNMVLAGDITPGTSLNTTATTIGGAINEIVARIPAPPTVDGTYTLSVTVSNGVPTYSWV